MESFFESSLSLWEMICGFYVFFCKRWAPFLPGFLTNQNFLGCACTPTSYTTETNQWMKKATTMSNDREGNI